MVDGLDQARGGVAIAGGVGRGLDFTEGLKERFREVVAVQEVDHAVEKTVVARVGSGQDVPGSVEMVKAGEELEQERLADAAGEGRTVEVNQGYAAHK